ncbi:polysaccharide lyase family 1 protein [Rhodoferax sp. BLA1]|uniref:pectate lyase family protein n=1 Tax=Rhodoferax sp. BLA1 TaxID=2576062 RepID=UPI0015D29963|nr:pectate lyase [Rhodoferax sp. BLA1]
MSWRVSRPLLPSYATTEPQDKTTNPLSGRIFTTLVGFTVLLSCWLVFHPQAQATDLSRQVLASQDGWAAAEGGTRGGSDAAPEQLFDVHNRAELVVALQRSGNLPKIIRLHGRIDLSVDDANRPLGAADYRDPAFDFEQYLQTYAPALWGKIPLTGPLEEARQRSVARQAARVTIRVPSNTTLLGVGHDAGLEHGMLLLSKVDNVILRNIHFSDAYDHFPAWDPQDNAHGEWNSEYDAVSLRGATHVWVDHCSFSDGDRPDHTARTALGRPMQHHDGLLDITQQSNFVTVSYNHFKEHDKTNLVGASDSYQLDANKLKVTFHHNLWEHTKERTPRVRYGQVHLYNNLYVAAKGIPYAYSYAIGVGVQSQIFSENNVWETTSDISSNSLAKLYKGNAFFDRGSLHNGRPVDVLAGLRAANPAATVSADLGWQPTLHETVDASADVAKIVRARAGAGRL